MAPFEPNHPLSRALEDKNYRDLTAVQAAVLEEGTAGRDLLVSAQTGSGKTVAYGLALAEDLLGDRPDLGPAQDPLALIVAPTRELALQVQRELTWLYAHAGARVISCVGGMDPRAEQRMLGRGVHIVVGTPGRLRDHLERGALQIGSLRALVLDEADEMLDLGFREDLEFILGATPPERRTLLFSATLPKQILGLAQQYQNDALRIAVAGGEKGHADIENRAVFVAPNEMEHALVNLLRFYESPVTMVFCNTRDSVRHAHAALFERGFSAVALSGELSQNERNHALQSLRDGRARVCVATDVAARGIDLPNLDLVVHAELPLNPATFQHRSGRTGRAGRKGTSVLMVPLSRRRRAEALLQAAGVKAQWGGAPSADDVRKLDQDRLLQEMLTAEDVAEEDLSLGRLLLESLSPEQVAAALVKLYRARLPSPEEVFDLSAEPPPRQPREAAPRAPDAGRNSGQPTRWFRMALGRTKNADPRWLLPMICRAGKITKQDIGAIRIFERETKFEVYENVADRFTAALTQGERPEIRIEPIAEGPGAGETESPRPRKTFGKKPMDGERAGKHAWKGKPPKTDHPYKGPPKGAKKAPQPK